MNVNEQIGELRGYVWKIMINDAGVPIHGQYDRNDNICGPMPDWEHDIAAAWGLVEEVRAADKHWSPIIYWDDGDGVGVEEWVCEFDYFEETSEEYKEYRAEADTAPAAISMAWLKWKGAK